MRQRPLFDSFTGSLLQPETGQQWIHQNSQGSIQLRRLGRWSPWLSPHPSPYDPCWLQALRYRYWNNPPGWEKCVSSERSLPLQGLKIVLDPGHIGGRWAVVEQRSVATTHGRNLAEGDLTLALAQWLQSLLRNHGAIVAWTRQTCEPLIAPPTGSSIEQQRNHCRSLEIAARARRINRILQPDCVICLHFDAAADPTTDNHWHLLVNGAYSATELACPSQRIALAWRYLSGTLAAEQHLATICARSFQHSLQLPSYSYPSTAAASSTPHPSVWRRNLMANRLYRCPVLFTEAYLLNNPQTARQGLAELDRIRTKGAPPAGGILDRYATAITDGLVDWACQIQ